MTDERNGNGPPPGDDDLPGDTWVTLGEAADLTGYNPGSLRLLAKEWEQENPPTARKSGDIWLVLLGRVRQHAEEKLGPYGPRSDSEL